MKQASCLGVFTCYQPTKAQSKSLTFCNVHEQLNPYDEQQSEVTVNGHFHVHNMVIVV